MQNFILIILVLGLAFFLYLIGTGEIDSNTFNIRNIQGNTHFSIEKLESISLQNSEVLRLNIKGNPYDIFNSTGMTFSHIPRSEYYMKIYDIPLEAKDAVAGTWLGTRYVFYVVEELIDGSEFDVVYHVYKTEYSTDSVDPVEYSKFKSIKGLDMRNAVDVRY